MAGDKTPEDDPPQVSEKPVKAPLPEADRRRYQVAQQDRLKEGLRVLYG